MRWQDDNNSLVVRLVTGAVACGLLTTAAAFGQQQTPAIGYMFPAGGRAGTAVDVVLGGYDWTPDIETFVPSDEIGLDVTGTPSSVIVPEPPYWFGKKARRSPFMMPSETPARLTIPADAKPGIYRWQVANANGGTGTGRFVVSDCREILEQADRTAPQAIGMIPVVVNGQIRKIEEVDRYQLIAPGNGPLTLRLNAAAIGSALTASLEVRDASGHLVADASDTSGNDLCLTFAAKERQPYDVRLYDLDFRGNRAFVYRLSVTAGPHFLATIPAAGQRGETRDIEFVGYGVATGGGQLESVTRTVAIPNEPDDTFLTQLVTPFGPSGSVPILLSDIPEHVEAARSGDEAQPLAVPSAVTGVLAERFGLDRYAVDGKKGDVWSITLQSHAIGSMLDVAFSVLDREGQELKRSDDLPGTTDAGIEFTVPADGTYQLVVSDSSGRSGDRAATYRLAVRQATPGFTLSGPEFVNVPIGGKTQLAISATRAGGFTDPISIQIVGLPKGVSVADAIEIPAKKNLMKIELNGAADAGTVATMLQVSGRVRIGETEVVERVAPILLAVTLKPPFSLDAEGKNDVTKWPRGTTFPAPVLIQRDEGFTGDIVLEMAGRQGRHRQGINGPELTVPPDADRILYPVFLPEWLETTRTSRMVVNGVARVADPQGRVRYLSSKLKTRIGFLPTGALLKIDCDAPELEVVAGQPLNIPLTIDRAKGLTEVAKIELVQDQSSEGVLTAEPLTVEHGQSHAMLPVTSLVAEQFVGERTVKIRATVMQHGRLPVISETQILIAWPAN